MKYDVAVVTINLPVVVSLISYHQPSIKLTLTLIFVRHFSSLNKIQTPNDRISEFKE